MVRKTVKFLLAVINKGIALSNLQLQGDIALEVVGSAIFHICCEDLWANPQKEIKYN